MEQEDKIKILSNLVSFNTVNGNELPAAKYIQTVLAKYEIESKLIDLGNNQANLVVEFGSGNHPILAVSGHFDTVSVDKSAWKTNPFELTIKDGIMFGSGVTDMKGGVAALIISLIELKEQQIQLPGTIRLLLTAGEEVGMLGSHQLQKDGYMDDVDSLLIAEPTGYRIVYANKGEVDFEVTSIGKEAHSSRPNFGINAIQNLMDVLEETRAVIEKKAAENQSASLGKTTYTVDIFQGGIQVNAIPGIAKAEINTRIVPSYNNQQIIADFKQVVADFNRVHDGEIKVAIKMNISPVNADPKSKLINNIIKVATPFLNKTDYSESEVKQGQLMLEKQGFNPFSKDKIAVLTAAGGTDASELLVNKLNGASYAVFGPGNPLKMHQNNESTSLSMWLNFIEIYKKLFVCYFD
ncbi:ArgE/DapE family deacylase [Fructilactobacillus vespulae]|uniref:ArgE/DapE family deacylase n=1 Tax=Fructilactobacillus vespulae TaxID=1249630 RepID=UPI0039B55E71